MSTGADSEVYSMIHNLAKRRIKVHDLGTFMFNLDRIMSHEEDGTEFVRLMQKWMACR